MKDIDLSLRRGRVTAVIGPSGCGKSALVRCLNRMHEMSSGGYVEGHVFYQGEDIYSPRVDPVELRSRIGMVFQKPNPFPKSIFDNVAFGLKVNGIDDHISDRVERSLRRAAILGRGEGQAEAERPATFRWTAAASLYRQGAWPLSRR